VRRAGRCDRRILGDPRACTFDAASNICGRPARRHELPYAAGSAGVNRIWTGRETITTCASVPFGARQRRRDQLAPFGGPGGSLGIFTWSHRDLNFDFTSEPLSLFDDETKLATRVVAPYSDIMSTDLHRAKKRGAKILMWHGGADQLIRGASRCTTTARRRNATTASRPAALVPFLPCTGVTHSAARAAAAALFDTMVNWVETGNAPASIVSQNATLGSRPMCPYPQTAIYNGSGDPKVFASCTAAATSRRAPTRAWTASSSTSTRRQAPRGRRELQARRRRSRRASRRPCR